MRRIAVVLALALFAVGLGGSAAADTVAVAKAPPRANAVLAAVPTYDGAKLAWLDPATLRPLARRSVRLPGGASNAVFSPRGRYAAFGGPGSVGVRIVDVRRMKLVAQVARRSSQRHVAPVAWPEPRRLLVLDSPQGVENATHALLAVDPVARRTVGRTLRDSSAEMWSAWALAGRQLVALGQPTQHIGAVRVVVFGPGAGVVAAKQIGIAAGALPEVGPNDEHRARVAHPALTVDPAGRKAFVVDDRSLAEVDLGSLEVSYRRLSEPQSLLSRFLGWLEPAAHAKTISGFSRQATWLGDGVVAVSGSTYEENAVSSSGLQFVDTRTGTTRMLERGASGHVLSRGVLVAYGSSREAGASTWTGIGLSAFAADGTRLWSSLAEEPVGWAQIAGGYVYVATPENAFPQGVRVIDLSTGAVLRTVRGEMPFFVSRDSR